MIRYFQKIKSFLIKELPFRIENGFWRIEYINLDDAIAKFALPRLKHFRMNTMSHPAQLSKDEWDDILKNIIYSMEYTLNKFDRDYTEYFDYELVDKGHKLFGEYFNDLWS